MIIISRLLQDASHTDNNILLRLATQAEWVFDDRFLYFETLLCLWHLGIEPVLCRDPTFGFPYEESITDSDQSDTDEAGDDDDGDGDGDHDVANEIDNATITEANDDSDKEDEHGNLTEQFGCLGITAMLVTEENWAEPDKQELGVLALVTNSVTSMMFAAYLISHRADTYTCKYTEGKMSFRCALRTFLQCSWQLSRVGCDGRPGQEFGALPDEVKISSDGKRLLTKVGRIDWHEPPFWHPFKKVPGSAWNKFLKNVEQPVFSENPLTSTHVTSRLPSSAIKLVEPIEAYYTELERRFDEVSNLIHLHVFL